MNLYESLTLNPFLSRLCRPELTTWLSRQLLANPIASYRPGSTRRLFNRFRGFLTGPGVIWPALRPSDRRWGLLTGREDFWPALKKFWPALRNSDRWWDLLNGPADFWPALRTSDRPGSLLTDPDAFSSALSYSDRLSTLLDQTSSRFYLYSGGGVFFSYRTKIQNFYCRCWGILSGVGQYLCWQQAEMISNCVCTLYFVPKVQCVSL